ncbi:pilus assembly protein FimV [Burkholderia vietnamiensis]|uniref:FimV/HubP family polar landmark protein n=1 Tax=Burkholderia vietnamiensis TaxID=60552 RepID=A0AAW7SWV4_BURVI|nr:FimV/HubP family polar landmark protein [Burkholderia vietnamiensis]KKI38645.1 pilus assembly protein FimV [Burkholderia vietnamiensis]MDN7794377.1 FimV/HubP family polar landmark protein [Burkholderia vietnamiensis]HDR9186575.1 pilus assembly protein FimV [Burkholderia vietnamiensis]
MSRNSLFPRQSRLSRAVCGALAVLALGAAASAGAASPGEQPASAAGGAVPLTVTVQPGQSLNDLAKAATQSHDPGVLARAGRALFDANPQAFMKRDPSRLKVGATLTVPALDSTGAALVPAGAGAASGASAGSAAGGGSATVASAQHGASAAHPGSAAVVAPTASAASSAPIAPAAPAAPTSSANATAANNGASTSAGASATHGASSAATAQPAAPVGGASGPHVWNGAIQSAPSSASEAAAQPAAGGAAQHAQQQPAAAPAAGASQPRPSSLQQLLALKNRVLMELQKHGIGKPAPSGNVAPAPAAVRPVQGDVAASGAASSAVAGDAASGAASGAAASAVAPASAPVTTVAPPSPRATGQMDWRPAAAAGAAVVVLIAGFAWRKRRKARAADAAAASSADVPPAQSRDTAPVDTDLDASPRAVEPVPPTLPATPFSRDAATDVSLVTAAAVAAETADVREADVAPPPEEASTHDDHAEAEAEAPAAAHAAAALPPDVPAAAPAAADAPAETAPAAPTPTDTQHEALMQNAINALNSLDMPLPPRIADEHAVPQASEAQTESEQSATNGQAAPRPPLGATEASDERSVEHDDEFDWDPDATTPAEQAGGASTVPTPSSLPPLGARFGALKLDFDLDLPSAPDAELPALTPEELARIARNKLDLALEYVELGDLSGARTLLQEVVDANDAATRDDARALLAKLAADA